jgi:ribosome-associated protein
LSLVEEHWTSWLTEQKAEDIQSFSLVGVSDIVDEMLVATALNTRHLTYLAEDAMKRGRTLDVSLISADGLEGREWIVLDFGVYMVHLLLPEVRDTLDLEQLYSKMKRPEEDAI